jgi:hypothetical protein
MSLSLMEKLRRDNVTFVELKNGNYPWWKNLKNDLKNNNDISIQIRKGNYIDVYHNGGAILSRLKYNKKQKEFTAHIHLNYIPINKNKEEEYTGLTLNAECVKFTKTIELMAFSKFNESVLKAVKQRIKTRFDSKTEKAIQYKFATNDPCIIDTEFQFNEVEEESRIDLVRLDTREKKIVLIELKTIDDSRLFLEKEDPKGIFCQLKKYHEIARDNKEALRNYYEKVLQIKDDLGLPVPSIPNLTLSGWDVEPYPLLAFGDCTPEWIKYYRDGINDKIKTVAYGAYYYKKPYTLDLKPPKTDPGRQYFQKDKTP